MAVHRELMRCGLRITPDTSRIVSPKLVKVNCSARDLLGERLPQLYENSSEQAKKSMISDAIETMSYMEWEIALAKVRLNKLAVCGPVILAEALAGRKNKFSTNKFCR